MKRKIAQIGISILIVTMPFAAPAFAEIRAAVGKPLQEAQKLVRAKDYKTAMAEIDRADAVPNKTPEESAMVDIMKHYLAAASSPPQP